MNKNKNKQLTTRQNVVALLSLLLTASAANAVDVSAEFSTSIGRSDNILRTETNQIDGSIATVGTILDVQHASNKLDFNLYANADWMKYLDDEFDEEVVGGAVLNSNYEFIEERFTWGLRYNFGQQVFNPLAPLRPNNREDVSALTTGPDLVLPMGSRFEFGASANYSFTRFELNPNDQDRIGGRLRVTRLLNAGRSVSLIATTDNVEYDGGLSNPDFERNAYFLRFESLNSRGSIAIDLGVNELNLDGRSEGSDGTIFRLDFMRQIGNGMQLQLNAGTQYSDQGDIFRFFQNIQFDLRETEDVAGQSTPFRNNYGTLTFELTRPRTRLNTSFIYRHEDYEQLGVSDREIFRFNSLLSRDLTRRIFGDIGVSFLSRRFAEFDRKDRDTQYTAALGYRFSEGLSARISYQLFERDSTADVTEYNENRIFLQLNYVPKWSRN